MKFFGRRVRVVPGILVLLMACLLIFPMGQALWHSRTGGASPVMAASADESAGKSAASADPLLLLVNASHPLAANFTPTLASVNIAYFCDAGKDNRMDSRAAPYAEQLVQASRAAGASVVLVSGYRSHSYQTENFDRSVSRLMMQGQTASAASAATTESIAVPGTSEHETGLAMDVCSAGWFVSHTDLTADFDQTAAFRWLSAHAADYGFILRYPQDKTAVTGITYEPWHYRFVGAENAHKIVSSGLCLEEYLARGGR